MSNFFEGNISDLKKLVKPSKGKGGGSGQPPSNVMPVGEPQDDGDEQEQDQSEGQDQGQKPGQGQGSGPRTADIELPKGQTVTRDLPPDGKIEGEGLKGSDKPNSKPLTEQEIKETIERANAAQELDEKRKAQEREEGIGQGRGSRRRILPGDLAEKRNWKNILKELMVKRIEGNRTYSRVPSKSLSLRGQGVVLPGNLEDVDIGSIMVCIDTSGSISDEILNGFLSDLKNIFDTFKASKTFGVKMILWSDGPYKISEMFKGRQFEQCKEWTNTNVKSGGTAIAPVIDVSNTLIKQNKKIIGQVWFTDGEIGDLKPLPNVFQLFVINGYLGEFNKTFIMKVKSPQYAPPGKPVKIVRTNYGSKN